MKRLLESIEFKTSGGGSNFNPIDLIPSGVGSAGALKLGAKVLGKVALPIAVAMSAYNAYQGATDVELIILYLLDKEEKKNRFQMLND